MPISALIALLIAMFGSVSILTTDFEDEDIPEEDDDDGLDDSGDMISL